MFKYQKFIQRGLVVGLLTMGVAMSAAQADDDEEYGERQSSKMIGENRGRDMYGVQMNAKFKAECSNCHIAYTPNLLPAESWRKIMSGLDKHFGSDASLTDAENKEITAFLVSNASNRWKAPTSPLRITETAWFKQKHNSREVSPAVWKNPKVKSASNCGACHTRADKGDFNEDDIRMPR